MLEGGKKEDWGEKKKEMELEQKQKMQTEITQISKYNLCKFQCSV